MGRNQCCGQFCHLAIKLIPHYFLSILERQVLGGPGWKMLGPHQKFSSPSLLTKQHPFSFSLIFSLQTFPSSLKSTHPNIVLVKANQLSYMVFSLVQTRNSLFYQSHHIEVLVLFGSVKILQFFYVCYCIKIDQKLIICIENLGFWKKYLDCF